MEPGHPLAETNSARLPAPAYAALELGGTAAGPSPRPALRPAQNTSTPSYRSDHAALAESLDAEQLTAAKAFRGVVLVIAGPGSGKTRTMIQGIHLCLAQTAVKLNEIMAMTFTTKASREMTHRMGFGSYHPNDPARPWFGNFHSLCRRMIAEDPAAYGLRGRFTIVDEDDSLRLVKETIADFTTELDRDIHRYPLEHVASLIEHVKESLDGWPTWECLIGGATSDEDATYLTDIREIGARYNRRLDAANACDFSDLILRVCDTFEMRPDILRRWQERFRHFFVDEYQDTNGLQERFLRQIADLQQNLFAVGDDDQAVYGWRNARLDNLLGFEGYWRSRGADPRILRLQRNYRSTPTIVAAASSLVTHNRQRLGKQIQSTQTGGNNVIVVRHRTDADELTWLAHRAAVAIHAGSCAILTRSVRLAQDAERALTRAGVNCILLTGVSLFRREEIRDVMAWMRLVYNYRDASAFVRAADSVPRGIGPKMRQKIWKLADSITEPDEQTGRPRPICLAKAAAIYQAEHPGKATSGLAQMLQILRDALAYARENHTPAELFDYLYDRSGYREHLRLRHEQSSDADDAKRAENRIANLAALREFIEHVPDLDYLIEQSALGDSESDHQGKTVEILTLHGAKALEWDTVLLPGWEQGIVPHARSLDEGMLEEERRLAYVGMTRARRSLAISYATVRYNRAAEPSTFLAELNADFVSTLRADDDA